MRRKKTQHKTTTNLCQHINNQSDFQWKWNKIEKTNTEAKGNAHRANRTEEKTKLLLKEGKAYDYWQTCFFFGSHLIFAAPYM